MCEVNAKQATGGVYVGAVSLGAGAEATRTPDVTAAVKLLEHKAAELYDMASTLQGRIEPVLHLVPPCQAVAKDCPYSTPLASELHNIWRQYLATEEILRDVLSRLEL